MFGWDFVPGNVLFFSSEDAATLIWLMWACYINNYSAYANQITVNWLNVFLLGEWRSVQEWWCAPLSATYGWKRNFSPLAHWQYFQSKRRRKGGFIVAALLKVTKCFLFDSLNFHCKQRCKMLIACSYFSTLSPSVKSKWCPRVFSSLYTRFSPFFFKKGLK